MLGADGRLELGLVLTHACNLACSYCYTGEKKRVRMTLDTARRALDLGFAAMGPNGRLQVTFFGGEPLLERELLLSIADEARARSESTVLQMTTNGTLLDVELIEALQRARVHLALSIDGTRRAHEANRPLAGGGSSWDATIAALDLLLASQRPFDVISVVDPANILALAEGVRELLDRGVDSLTLNMNWAGVWNDDALTVFEKQLEEVGAIFIAWLRRGRFVRIEPLASTVHALADGASIEAARCDAGRRRIAVAPSGRLYPCPRSVGEDTGASAFGHLDHGLSLNASNTEVRCHCAAAEETGDARTVGPVQRKHDAIVEALAKRVLEVMRSEYASVHVIEEERQPDAIPY